jgi:hypothetical protein
MKNLTQDFNLANLQIAVNGIKALNIPEEKFKMETLGFLEDQSPANVKIMLEDYSCKTGACFLGWFPLVKELHPVESDYFECPISHCKHFDFEIYCNRILKFDCERQLYTTFRIWDFLFSASWWKHAPKLQDALNRAQIVLDGNYDPNWTFQEYSTSNKSLK